MTRAIRVSASVLLAVATIGVASAGVIRDDFRVDQSGDIDSPLAARIETLPSVASDNAGNFIITWRADGHMYARQFDPTGMPITDQFLVDVDEPGVTAEYPRVVMRPDGRYAYFVYTRESDDEGHAMIRRYRPRSHRLAGRARQIDDGTSSVQDPNLAIDPGLRELGAVWTAHQPAATPHYQAYFRALRRSGRPRGDPIPLQHLGQGVSESNPVYVSAQGAGVFIAAWPEVAATQALFDAVAQRVDALGPRGGAFLVAQCSVYCPLTEGGDPIARYLSSAGSPDGSALIAWTAVYPYEYHVWVRGFDRDGNPLGDEVRIDPGDPAYEALTQHLVSDPANIFTVVWMDNQHTNGGAGDRSDFQIHARRAGDPDRAEFHVESGPAGSVLFGFNTAHFQIPDVAASTGTLVFTWIDNRPVDPQHPATIFARVLSNPPDSGF